MAKLKDGSKVCEIVLMYDETNDLEISETILMNDETN